MKPAQEDNGDCASSVGKAALPLEVCIKGFVNPLTIFAWGCKIAGPFTDEEEPPAIMSRRCAFEGEGWPLTKGKA